MIWTDENGNHHWITTDGYHYMAILKPEPPDWTKEEQKSAKKFLFVGRLIVVLLAFLVIAEMLFLAHFTD